MRNGEHRASGSAEFRGCKRSKTKRVVEQVFVSIGCRVRDILSRVWSAGVREMVLKVRGDRGRAYIPE
jgi:hypothetical protein